MEIDIVSFTGRGEALAKRVEEAFAGAHVCVYEVGKAAGRRELCAGSPCGMD